MTGPQKIRTVDGTIYYVKEDPTRASGWVRAYDYDGHSVRVPVQSIVEYDDGMHIFDDRKMSHRREEA